MAYYVPPPEKRGDTSSVSPIKLRPWILQIAKLMLKQSLVWYPWILLVYQF